MSAFPLPEPGFAGARPFWEAAARGELAIPRCAACRAYVWYPRERCPACGGGELPWEPVSGRGTLFSFTIVRQALALQRRVEVAGHARRRPAGVVAVVVADRGVVFGQAWVHVNVLLAGGRGAVWPGVAVASSASLRGNPSASVAVTVGPAAA